MTKIYNKALTVHHEQDSTGGHYISIRRGLAFTFRIRLSEATALADQLVDIVEEVDQ